MKRALIGIILLIELIAGDAYAFRLEQENPHLNIQNERLSFKGLRTQGVVMQGFDLSCGTAALATIFQFYYGEKIEEKEILEFILEKRKEALKRNQQEPEGLSLLDLKLAAGHFHFKAGGFEIPYESLADLDGPVIVHLKGDFGGHFAVLKGFVGDRVYLADPSRGNIRMTPYKFKKKWSGVIFVVEHPHKVPLKNSPLVLIKKTS